jgi:hypothetical protein
MFEAAFLKLNSLELGFFYVKPDILQILSFMKNFSGDGFASLLSLKSSLRIVKIRFFPLCLFSTCAEYQKMEVRITLSLDQQSHYP